MQHHTDSALPASAAYATEWFAATPFSVPDMHAVIERVQAAITDGETQLGSARGRLQQDDDNASSTAAALWAMSAVCGGAEVAESVLVSVILTTCPANEERRLQALAAGLRVVGRMHSAFPLLPCADEAVLFASVAGAGAAGWLDGLDPVGIAAALDICASLLPAAARRTPQVQAALAGLAADQAVRSVLAHHAGFITPPRMIEAAFESILPATASTEPADTGARGILDALVDFVERHRDGHFPAHVVRAATRDIADTLANVVGGASAAPVRALTAAAVGQEHHAAPLSWPGFLDLAPLTAARTMSVSALWLDLDTGIYRHPATRRAVPTSHPTIHILPAMMAELQRSAQQVSQHAFLMAFTLGYEVSARLSAGCHLRKGIHPHGVAAAAGTAVALGLLRGHDRATLHRALDLACDLTRMPLMASALRGGSVRNLNGAAGLSGAWIATRLAEAGWQGAGDIAGGALGSMAADWLDTATVVKDLGTHWEMALGYIKVHACCRFNHPALDVLLALVDRHRFDIRTVERIDVRTFGNAAMMNNPAPRTDLGAKFSIPWSMASATAYGHAGVGAFQDAALARPDIQALALKVAVTEDPAFTAAMPARRPTTVTVTLIDGTALFGETDHSRGDPPDPFPDEVLASKFRALLALDGAFTSAQAEARLQAIHAMPNNAASARVLFSAAA